MLAMLDELGGPQRRRTIRWAGRGRAIRRSSGASALGRIWAARAIRWSCFGRKIKDAGGVRYQFEDVTDVAPTILEAAGLPEP